MRPKRAFRGFALYLRSVLQLDYAPPVADKSPTGLVPHISGINVQLLCGVRLEPAQELGVCSQVQSGILTVQKVLPSMPAVDMRQNPQMGYPLTFLRKGIHSNKTGWEETSKMLTSTLSKVLRFSIEQKVPISYFVINDFNPNQNLPNNLFHLM